MKHRSEGCRPNGVNRAQTEGTTCQPTGSGSARSIDLYLQDQRPLTFQFSGILVAWQAKTMIEFSMAFF